MAEDIAVATPPTTPAVDPQIDQMMKIGFGDFSSLRQPDQQTTPDTPTPAADTPPVTPDTPPPTTPDIFAPFKEKFGYQSPEDALKEIEELRALKANPQVPEFEFENEDSKKFFNAALKGDRKTIKSILDKQDMLERLTSTEVSKDTAADIIKAAMKIETDLDQAEIDFQYKETYTPPKEPKEPVQRASETEDEFNERHDDWKERHDDWKQQVANLEMKAIIAAKMAKPKLEAAKTKLVFPEIEADPDEDYAQYRKELEEKPRLNAEIAAAYKTFKPEDIGTKVPFTDEQSKVNFEYQYTPDVESFNKTVELVSDMDKFYGFFKNQDGTPDRKKFLEAMYFGLNKDRIILEALKQSKNATIKASLPDNTSGGLQRQFPQRQELSEVDKLMQMSLTVK